jgi:F0F1-type ATP synthase assembly protein I
MSHVFSGPTTRFGQEFAVTPTTPENPDDKQQSRLLWSYASEGTQIAITLLVGVFVGYKLDARWDTSPWLTLAGSLLGIVLGLYSFLRRAVKW